MYINVHKCTQMYANVHKQMYTNVHKLVHKSGSQKFTNRYTNWYTNWYTNPSIFIYTNFPVSRSGFFVGSKILGVDLTIRFSLIIGSPQTTRNSTSHFFEQNNTRLLSEITLSDPYLYIILFLLLLGYYFYFYFYFYFYNIVV